MKIGDTIAIPGYGEYKLSIGTCLCFGCAGFSDIKLCEALPTSYCTQPRDSHGEFPDIVFLKVEK